MPPKVRTGKIVVSESYNPGGHAAIVRERCTCPQELNQYGWGGVGAYYPGEFFFSRRNCPVHGERAQFLSEVCIYVD